MGFELLEAIIGLLGKSQRSPRSEAEPAALAEQPPESIADAAWPLHPMILTGATSSAQPTPESPTSETTAPVASAAKAPATQTPLTQATPAWAADCISVRGYSHLLSGKECQDNSLCWQDRKYAGVVVSDGHGGDKYFRSAVGSALACQVGKAMLTRFMETLSYDKSFRHAFFDNPQEQEQQLRQLEYSILYYWRKCVMEHRRENPFSQDECYATLQRSDREAICRSPIKAYGATFLGAVMSDTFFFLLKLGDGNAAILTSDQRVFLLNHYSQLEDEQLQFNVTTSLCNGNAEASFRHCFYSSRYRCSVQGLLLTTDGVINSYTSEQGYLGLAQNIFAGYREQSQEAARAELAGFLPRLSEKGSGDDLTAAILYRKGDAMR